MKCPCCGHTFTARPAPALGGPAQARPAEAAPTQAHPGPAQDWYYAHEGEQFGPVSEERLKQLAACGGLLPSDLVWQEGMPSWAAAGTVPGLISENRPAARLRAFAPATRGKAGVGRFLSNLLTTSVEVVLLKVYLDGRFAGESDQRDGFDYQFELQAGTHTLEVISWWHHGEGGRKKFLLRLDQPGEYEVRFNYVQDIGKFTINGSTIDMTRQPS